jgi:hypothetical protein
MWFEGLVLRVHLPELAHCARLADADTTHQTGACTSRVCATRKAKEEEFIARRVVVHKEVVSFADILVESSSKCA